MIHLWQGQRLDTTQLNRNLTTLRTTVDRTFENPLNIETVLRACDALSQELLTLAPVTNAIQKALQPVFATPKELKEGLAEIATIISRKSLTTKLERELGSLDPFTPRRFDYRQPIFEGWAPLGLLLHVAPGNAFAVGVLSVVEGLLTGNINILKMSSADTDFPIEFLERLGQLDHSGQLKQFLFAMRVSSSQKDLLSQIMQECAGVAAWGGEEAISSLRKMAPSGCRVVDWGHRLSFAYVSRDLLDDYQQLTSNNSDILRRLGADICLIEQQACSSPQCIYLDTEDSALLQKFADDLSGVLAELSQKQGAPLAGPSSAEQAEITLTTAVMQCEAALGFGSVIEPRDKSWRIMVDYRSALRASPLYRSIWIKPLPAKKIFETLWPMREFLQTVGLACSTRELGDLSQRFTTAGVLRMTEVGRMLESYTGEPHDGVYALPRYARRVSYQAPSLGKDIATFAELRAYTPPLPWTPSQSPAIMGKKEFQNLNIEQEYADLFFKSGGSSGDPKISVFTYQDYHQQMYLAAEGLLAAGLDPATDRCMNLFFGGGLYGGFVSFFTILEHLRVVQFPMAAHLDFAFVADMILKYKVNTILGMPSYIIQLFYAAENFQRFKDEQPVKKIFFGGEHFNLKQRTLFEEDFGVEIIRSATYGSVDSGPLGYQCQYCEGSVHHLHQHLQHLEILDPLNDKPVQNFDDVGRLVFTSLIRDGQKLHRYDIGDLGRWKSGDCPCGRAAPRFELMGRHGDVFRAAGTFFNYQKFVQVVSEYCDYQGELQIQIERMADQKDSSQKDRLCIFLDPQAKTKEETILATLIEKYGELKETVVDEGTLSITVEVVDHSQFSRTAGSGKLQRVVDRRG